MSHSLHHTDAADTAKLLQELGGIGSIGVVQGMAHGAASFLIWIFTESQKRNSVEQGRFAFVTRQINEESRGGRLSGTPPAAGVWGT